MKNLNRCHSSDLNLRAMPPSNTPEGWGGQEKGKIGKHTVEASVTKLTAAE